MADNNAESCKPSGTAPSKDDKGISQHKKMAMGNPPKPTGPPSPRW